MKSSENVNDLNTLKSMLLFSLVFLFFLGFVSAFGTTQKGLLSESFFHFLLLHHLKMSSITFLMSRFGFLYVAFCLPSLSKAFALTNFPFSS